MSSGGNVKVVCPLFGDREGAVGVKGEPDVIKDGVLGGKSGDFKTSSGGVTVLATCEYTESRSLESPSVCIKLETIELFLIDFSTKYKSFLLRLSDFFAILRRTNKITDDRVARKARLPNKITNGKLCSFTIEPLLYAACFPVWL